MPFPVSFGRLADSQNVFVSLINAEFFIFSSAVLVSQNISLFESLSMFTVYFKYIIFPYVYIVGFQSLMNFKNTLTTKIWYTKYLTLLSVHWQQLVIYMSTFYYTLDLHICLPLQLFVRYLWEQVCFHPQNYGVSINFLYSYLSNLYLYLCLSIIYLQRETLITDPFVSWYFSIPSTVQLQQIIFGWTYVVIFSSL